MSATHIQFAPRGPFFEAIKTRVDNYFAEAGKRTTGDWRLHAKTLFSFGVMLSGYIGLVWFVEHWWSASTPGPATPRASSPTAA